MRRYSSRVLVWQETWLATVFVSMAAIGLAAGWAGPEWTYALIYLPVAAILWNLAVAPVSACVGGMLWFLRARPAGSLRVAAVLGSVTASLAEWAIGATLSSQPDPQPPELTIVLLIVAVLVFGAFFPLPRGSGRAAARVVPGRS